MAAWLRNNRPAVAPLCSFLVRKIPPFTKVFRIPVAFCFKRLAPAGRPFKTSGMRIVILNRIYSEFQKHPDWAFLAFESLNDSFSVEDGQCLNSQ